MKKIIEYYHVFKWLMRNKQLIKWIKKSNNDANLWEVWSGENKEYYAIGFFKNSPTGVSYKDRFFDTIHDKKQTKDILKEMKSYSYNFKHDSNN